ncbi:uncharacterized protein [Petaurus breviceps papuanus]|uniref:uncharacterized protein n=1 Tax=Petaurus breviceps papuanus TaxID=3040969 RepID=UPI0036DC7A51
MTTRPGLPPPEPLPRRQRPARPGPKAPEGERPQPRAAAPPPGRADPGEPAGPRRSGQAPSPTPAARPEAVPSCGLGCAWAPAGESAAASRRPGSPGLLTSPGRCAPPAAAQQGFQLRLPPVLLLLPLVPLVPLPKPPPPPPQPGPKRSPLTSLPPAHTAHPPPPPPLLRTPPPPLKHPQRRLCPPLHPAPSPGPDPHWHFGLYASDQSRARDPPNCPCHWPARLSLRCAVSRPRSLS